MTSSPTPIPTIPAPLLLSSLPTIGAARYWSLVNTLGSADKVLNTSPDLLTSLSSNAKHALAEYQKLGTESPLAQGAQRIINCVKQHDSQIITCEDKLFPALLKEIHRPPPVLYVKGNLDNLCLPQIALIGSRHATHQGLQNTQRFSTYLANSGFTITSGLALGIDSAAHKATLNTNGKTIAVMATGIDQVYPRRHATLADDIITQGGALVTEFPPFSSPKAAHFPQRNRIISGLSLGVLVVEATIKSGSLITAKYALEQNREVFAIPGSIHSPQSKGCHQLIKQGATLVETAEDIVEHLQGFISSLMITNHPDEKIQQPHHQKKLDIHSLNTEEALIIQHLGFEIMSIDQLIAITQLNNHTITTILLNLQIKGWITRSDWGYERV